MKKLTNAKISKDVAAIIARVRKEGDRAVIRFAKKFDRVDLQPREFKISPAKIKAASKGIGKEIKSALMACAARIKFFHLLEKKMAGKSWATVRNGVKTGQIVNTVE